MPRSRKVALIGALLRSRLRRRLSSSELTASARARQLLDQVMSLVNDRYVDTLPASDVYEKAARGLVRELNDPYSELLTPKDLKQFNSRTGGRYGGLGMLIERGPADALITVGRSIRTRRPKVAAFARATASSRSDRSDTQGWTI